MSPLLVLKISLLICVRLCAVLQPEQLEAHASGNAYCKVWQGTNPATLPPSHNWRIVGRAHVKLPVEWLVGCPFCLPVSI